jgi:nucleotide-binding universal stress UspA family protein
MIKLATKRILVPVDFSETSLLALRHACFLAQLTKGEVFLLHVIQRNHEVYNVIQPELNIDVAMKDVAGVLEKRLAALAKELHHEFGITVRDLVSSGNVSLEVVKICQEEKCTMIIMGTQGYSALEMIFIGSVTMKVLGASKVPVMSVRSAASKSGYKNVILPIDSSQHSRQKVSMAIDLCHEFGARLFVLGLTDEDDSNFDMKLGIIFRQVEELAARKNVQVTHHMEKDVANRAKATLKYAERVNGDLIIIMSDQDVELSGIFLGPFSQQVINYSKIPVLTVMPEENNDISFSTPGTASW